MSSVVTSECHASIEETTCQEVAETLDARTGAHQLNVWSAKATLPSDPEREKFNSHDGDEAALPTLLQSRGRGPAVDEDNDAKDPHQTADKPVEDADHGSDFEDAEEAEKEVEEEAAAELDEEARRRAAERAERAERAKDAELFWTAAQAALRERERREKVAAFLKIHHFSDVNARRGWIWNYDYPLHCAAKHADVEMVRLLLVSKAVRRQKNCDGLTARAVAKMQNVFGSHDAVIKASLPRTEEARPHTEAPLQPAVLQLAAAEALQLAETDRGTADACAQRDLGDRPVGEADGI
mmetsp:Transcript_177333/g.568586  ORF Transcript_177333/g.568586 Transcript_177333/m.568586 type:complete len:296 (+) Transcript_177333:87-974(+)